MRQTPDSIGIIYTVGDDPAATLPDDLQSFPFLPQKLLAIASKQNKQAQQARPSLFTIFWKRAGAVHLLQAGRKPAAALSAPVRNAPHQIHCQ